MAQSQRNCYCSVPQCSNNKKNVPYLSFQDFPADAKIRARWVTAIKRDEGPNFKILRCNTYVCSQHFSSEETYVSASGRKKLKKGAVPSKFPWNDWGKGRGEQSARRARKRLAADNEMPVPGRSTEDWSHLEAVQKDHDYSCHLFPDIEITKKSQLLQLLRPGDEVMADKGFLIEKMLSEVEVKLIIPPLKKSTQLSKPDTQKTQAIARLRMLVERAIRRVKEYHIWDGIVPLSMVGSVNQLWAICCLMSNFQRPLDVKGDKPVLGLLAWMLSYCKRRYSYDTKRL